MPALSRSATQRPRPEGPLPGSRRQTPRLTGLLLSGLLLSGLILVAALSPLLAGAEAARAGQPSSRQAGQDLEQPAALAWLHVEDADDGDGRWIVVGNPLHGPIEVQVIEVQVQADHAGLRSDPPLPARSVLPAMTQRAIARIGHAARQPRLRLTGVPGRPGSLASDVEYGLPLRDPVLRVTQGWSGNSSHAAPEHRHAVDFATPTGTPVLAARDGVVMQVESRFSDLGYSGKHAPDNDDIDRANFIRVLHADGSMALYAHLQRAGVQVRPGQQVRRGDAIALSGNSGFSHGPHLHFVAQVNRGMRLESVPFRMFGPHGTLRFNPGQAGGSPLP